ncbi:MAG: hypothetical protein ABIJ21_09515 [Nanoarchaeota archaeon]
MEKEVNPREDFHVLIGVFAIILLVFILFLSLANDSDVLNVTLGLLPTVGYLVINYALLYELAHKRFLVWILPIILVIIFYLFAASFKTSTIGQMDLNVITFLNLFVCYVFAGVILFYIYVGREVRFERRAVLQEVRHEMAHQPTHAVHHAVPKPESVKTIIQSIEDKAKAINFVIGRVYSDKHGGSKELREKIRIDKEWYNKFSALSQDFTESDKEMVRLAIELIHKRILLLEKKEIDVFDTVHFQNIEHDARGHDTIKSVLIKNDKDPVETYLDSMKGYCEHILRELKKSEP